MVIENSPVEMMIGNLLVDELVDNKLINKVIEVKQSKVTDIMQTIILENECTIYEVAEKHQQIIERWPDQSQSITINLANVTEIDSCFIQLLMSCKKTALEKRAECYFINPSAEVEEKFKGLFVSELLEH
jgi:anti-anti-sigma regulatory factor